MILAQTRTYNAGILKQVKDTSNSLEINDVKNVALAGDPISARALRQKMKTLYVAGIAGARTTHTQSISFGN